MDGSTNDLHRLLVELVADVMTHVLEHFNTRANHLQLVVLRLYYQLHTMTTRIIKPT